MFTCLVRMIVADAVALLRPDMLYTGALWSQYLVVANRSVLLLVLLVRNRIGYPAAVDYHYAATFVLVFIPAKRVSN